MYPPLLLVTCARLFSGCCLAVHWGYTTPEEHASPLEALQEVDEGSKCLASPASIRNLHSNSSQREQQTVAHCHRPHRPNHREEFTSRLSDKVGFKFHSETLDKKAVVINRELLTNGKGSGQTLYRSVELNVGAGHPEGSCGVTYSPVLVLRQFEQSGRVLGTEAVPAPSPQDCDCNETYILGEPGLSLIFGLTRTRCV